MQVNVIVLVVAMGCATVFGLWFRRYNGHFRGAARAEVPFGAAPTDRGDQGDQADNAEEPDLRSDLARPARDGYGDGHGDGELGSHHVRVEASSPSARIVLTAEQLSASLGERATLLQFSSAFCAPCRVTRRVLGEVATMVPGVAHIELDAESHLELVRQLGVMRTPTTFILDADGQIVSRASGAPGKADAIAALGYVIN
jgi:thiol-disulfide isomerase/thioredoxin